MVHFAFLVRDMTITEPATLVTDYILALAAVIFGVLVWRSHRFQYRSTRLWISGFLTVSAAAAVGGTYHGFALYFSEPAHRTLWHVTSFLIVVGTVLMGLAIFCGPLGRHGRNTPWIVSGGLVTAAGVAIQQSGFAVHPHFNHNDLYHCVQTAALYLLFRGTKPSYES